MKPSIVISIKIAKGYYIIEWHERPQNIEWYEAICSTANKTLLACQPIRTKLTRSTMAYYKALS